VLVIRQEISNQASLFLHRMMRGAWTRTHEALHYCIERVHLYYYDHYPYVEVVLPSIASDIIYFFHDTNIFVASYKS